MADLWLYYSTRLKSKAAERLWSSLTSLGLLIALLKPFKGVTCFGKGRWFFCKSSGVAPTRGSGASLKGLWLFTRIQRIRRVSQALIYDTFTDLFLWHVELDCRRRSADWTLIQNKKRITKTKGFCFGLLCRRDTGKGEALTAEDVLWTWPLTSSATGCSLVWWTLALSLWWRESKTWFSNNTWVPPPLILSQHKDSSSTKALACLLLWAFLTLNPVYQSYSPDSSDGHCIITGIETPEPDRGKRQRYEWDWSEKSCSG